MISFSSFFSHLFSAIKHKSTPVFIIFGLIFAAISFVNHYNFRTYGWDLGINHNAIYDYAHFRWNDCMIMQPKFDNVLADHFSLYPLLISPLYWIFGTWTMLFFQWLAILFGGWGIFRYVKELTKDEHLSLIALIHFFSIWGIYSALSFDYHDNVVAAMFVPWLLLYFRQKKWRNVLIFFTLILIAKENMALWAVFIGLGLGLRAWYDKDRESAKWGGILCLSAAVYFVVVLKGIIPALATPGREYLHNSFNALGSNFGEVIVNILKHPIRAFQLLFENHNGDPYYDGIKAETYLAIALAGGFALVLAPEYALMLVPIIAQKVYNDVPVRWGISDHYSIEFAPIIVIGLYTVIHRMRRLKHHIALVTLLICMVSTVSFLDHRISEYYKKDNTQFYKKEHWKRDFDVKAVHRDLKTIPKNARVSAQSMLAPHLAFRDYIYHYPHVDDANFIALLPADPNRYPQNDSTYFAAINEFKNSGEWIIFKETKALLILKKKE